MNTAGFPAILVDWADYQEFENVRKYVDRKSRHAEVVLLISDPDDGNTPPEDNIFSVVITNNQPLSERGRGEFYYSAVQLVRDVSNLHPSVMLVGRRVESAEGVAATVLEEGVLVVIEADSVS